MRSLEEPGKAHKIPVSAAVKLHCRVVSCRLWICDGSADGVKVHANMSKILCVHSGIQIKIMTQNS